MKAVFELLQPQAINAFSASHTHTYMAAKSLSSTLSSSATSKKHCGLSISVISIPQSTNLQLGVCKFSTWNGLKHQGVPTSRYIVKIERRGRCSRKGVYASLFGVGAPEVLVIGVVALLVFGPRGLAEVARNIGKTIRAFQPTIRELQEVSRDLKSTLEREIGLDEIQEATKTTSSSSLTATSMDSKKDIERNVSPSSSNASLTEERVKTVDELLEASAAQQQKEIASADSSVEPENQTQEADSTMEYLKKLEKEWEALNSEKRKKTASAATEVNTQEVFPYSTSLNEEHVKTAEEKLEASVSQQQEEMFSAETPVNLEGQSQDGFPSSTEADSIQEYLKKLGQEWEALNSEKQTKMATPATEVKSQDTQEAVSATPVSQKPENEDQMSEELHDDNRSSVEHQLL